MKPIKDFEITKVSGLTLRNTADRDVFLCDKIKLFSDHKNYSDKAQMLLLLQEVLAMYIHDCATATFDIADVNDICFFDLQEHREIMIAYYDIIHMLGFVFLQIFDLPGNRLLRVEEGINGPISTAQMLMVAYSDLENCKSGNKAPYGANLIFATLLEKDLKAIVKIECAKDWLTLLQRQVNSGDITLTAKDADYFDYLNFEYELSATRSANVYDSVKATTSEFYQFLCKYSIIPADDEHKKLVNNEFTLNQFLDSSFCKAKLHPDYLQITKMLFKNKKLNLRNNLAHCNFGYLNYHTSCVGALLYGLFSMISTRICLA